MSFLSKFFEILEGKKRNLVGVESDDDSIDFEEDMYEVGEIHDIDAYITNDNFPSYTIEKNIHPNRFDSSAHPSCMPISYLFSLSGKPVLAVLFMNTNQYKAMISRGTYKILEENNIPYIRFFKTFDNEKDYVINRIISYLG